MINTKRANRGMVVAPHHLASTAGLRVLQDGGNAVEAMIAAACTIAIVYPHMNGLGGDNFWLIHQSKGGVQGIDACGAAAARASIDFYTAHNCAQIPDRGPLAALTVAGAVSGWASAHEYSQKELGGKLPLSRLLEDAIYYASEGVAVTDTLANNAAAKRAELEPQPGFANMYLPGGQPVTTGELLVQRKVANTLQSLVKNGLEDFYHGELAESIANDLDSVGSPLQISDFNRHTALMVEPLSLSVAGHTLYNMPPPTQGLASLMLLGIYERLTVSDADSFDYIHALVEATKAAFRIRDSKVSDPAFMVEPASSFLDSALLDELASNIDMCQAAPWPDATTSGDTVWLGAIDAKGNAVSFIQSVYWEFGSGVVLSDTGVTWQNRGTSFSLDAAHHNCLNPGRRPFHTIQPALAHLSDGRIMPYGTMGGEGQPQTQAMLFSRYALHNKGLQYSVSSPRWLLGKTWGSTATNLRIEARFDDAVYKLLIAAGHDVEIVGAYDEVMGHAGALVRHTSGIIEGAADPRSDGAALGF